MKLTEVPQDKGMIGEHGREVCYAVDQSGRYTLASSLGWEAKNVVNDQAWDEIVRHTEQILTQVKQGILSPLAFHQARHQMDVSLLAAYAGMARWRVKRHLKAKVFRKLPVRIKARYAAVFRMTVVQLETVPESLSLTDIQHS